MFSCLFFSSFFSLIDLDETIFDPCTGCEIPCSQFTSYPPEIMKDIDQGSMIGSVDRHRRHICIGQPVIPTEWPKDVKDLQDGYIKELTRLLKEKKDAIGYTIKLTSASITSTSIDQHSTSTADWYVFPDQIKLINVNMQQIEHVIQTLFVDDRSTIQIKNPITTIEEQLQQGNPLPTFNENILCERLNGVWILVCCHYQRDQRCGKLLRHVRHCQVENNRKDDKSTSSFRSCRLIIDSNEYVH
jgi:hypothetical protein